MCCLLVTVYVCHIVMIYANFSFQSRFDFPAEEKKYTVKNHCLFIENDIMLLQPHFQLKVPYE